MSKRLFTLLAATVLLAAPAIAGPAANSKAEPKGNANGQGCNSLGAPYSANPGEWLRTLRDHPALLDLTPAQLAELENTTADWAGYGQTPNVGALIRFFCGN